MLFNNFNIDEKTLISDGLALSKNFILAHTSSGAYHYVLGQIMPQFTAFLTPGSSSLPTWQVAKNLQMGVQGILDNLMKQFGSDLIIRSGFKGLSNLTSQIPGAPQLQQLSNLGQSFSIQVKGYENNMYNVAKSVQSIANKASSIELVYGNSSFMNIDFNETSIKNNLFNGTPPTLKTSDTLMDIIETGITSIRGI